MVDGGERKALLMSKFICYVFLSESSKMKTTLLKKTLIALLVYITQDEKIRIGIFIQTEIIYLVIAWKNEFSCYFYSLFFSLNDNVLNNDNMEIAL